MRVSSIALTFVAGGVWATLLASPPAAPPAPGAYGVFAYADSGGSRFLALSPPPDPDSVVEAVCQSRTRLRVRFVGRQPRSPQDNGRQRAANFAHEEGAVFEAVAGHAGPDETCFLATRALLALGPPIIPRSPADSLCARGDSARLSRARGRAVVSCARILTVGHQTHVVAVEFRRVMTRDSAPPETALASLVVVAPDSMTFLDFPAEPGPGGDTWRVGDGGRFDASGFAVLFVVGGPSGMVIALTWAAEEGESLVLAATGAAADTFVPVARDYRYWLPQ